MARPTVPVNRSQQLAWLITGPLLVLAVALTIPATLGVRHPWGSVPLDLAFLGLFVFADATLLRFEVRRQAFSMSLAEIPLLLALFYLPPLAVLCVRTISGAAIQRVLRSDLPKAAFNVAQFAAGTAAANLIVHTYLRPHDVGPRTWAVLAAAVLTNLLVTYTATGGVITLVQGLAVSRQFIRGLVPASIVAAVNITGSETGSSADPSYPAFWLPFQDIQTHNHAAQWTSAVVFGYLIMILVLRPRGLLGEETREAG